MTGINVTINEKDLQNIVDQLNRLERLASSQDALAQIGERLLQNTRERFSTHTASDGTPWAELADKTKEQKHRNKNKILTLRGHLQSRLRW